MSWSFSLDVLVGELVLVIVQLASECGISLFDIPRIDDRIEAFEDRRKTGLPFSGRRPRLREGLIRLQILHQRQVFQRLPRPGHPGIQHLPVGQRIALKIRRVNFADPRFEKQYLVSEICVQVGDYTVF